LQNSKLFSKGFPPLLVASVRVCTHIHISAEAPEGTGAMNVKSSAYFSVTVIKGYCPKISPGRYT